MASKCKLRYCLIICLGIIFFSAHGKSNIAQDGKSLFKENCGSCHEPGRVLTGPDIQKISQRRTNEWLIKFIRNSEEMIKNGDDEAIKIFMDFKQVKMPAVNLSDSEIVLIINYLDTVKVDSFQQNSMDFNIKSLKSGNDANKLKIWITLFIIVLLLLIISKIQPKTFQKNKVLLLFKLLYKIKQVESIIPLFITRSVLLIFLLFFLWNSFNSYRKYLKNRLINDMISTVEFSHQQHYSDYQINCIYCHVAAKDNFFANIPSANHCMKCHQYIRSGENTGRNEINKLVSIYSKNLNYQHKTGYRFRKHVRFDHGLHVTSAQISCVTCHSDTNNVTIRYRQFSMKWCNECHQRNNYPKQNKFYPWYYKSANYVKINNDCILCHY